MKPRRRIAFLHLEMGIGGAERVVVDAALYLQKRGHRVTIFTTRCDSGDCFKGARDGSLDVRIHGRFLPPCLGGRLRAPCAILRTAFLAWVAGLRNRFDLIFVDFVPDAIALVKLFTKGKVIYYCHYPDRLLSTRGLFYSLYRAPIDRLEANGIRTADRLLVNSHFTASEFQRVYPHRLPEVLYPGVEIVSDDRPPVVYDSATSTDSGHIVLLSINRFERKKNVGLALRALALLRGRVAAGTWARMKLVIGGSYDSRWREAREVLSELRTCARDLGLEHHAIFKPSVSDEERMWDLDRCLCVLYTPQNEPFGLVPLEAMAAGKPVIAVNSGGPVETIPNGETGFVCDPSPDAFADAIALFVANPDLAVRMGRAGREHVKQRFSRDAFGARLESIMQEVADGSSGKSSVFPETVLR